MRILVDTNVLSELYKPKPDPKVVQRIGQSAPGTSFVSVISIGEIVYGIARMPQSAKRRTLTAWLAGLERSYEGQILPVDTETSRIWGELTASCMAGGRPLSVADGLIAATALRHGMHLMTRNTTHFTGAGVLLINPWRE